MLFVKITAQDVSVNYQNYDESKHGQQTGSK